MTETGTAAKEVASGLRDMFARVGDFFHLFDFSFFVSGVSTVGAVTLGVMERGYTISFPFPTWAGVIALLVACYIAGLMSFSIGRWVNGRLFRAKVFDKTMSEALKGHGVERAPVITPYTNAQPPDLWRLYIRLWQEVARKPTQSLAFSHLSRYWVMAATYDGLGASFLLWGIAAILSSLPTTAGERAQGITGLVLGLLLAVQAFWQGASYYRYQIEEVVAAIVAETRDVL